MSGSDKAEDPCIKAQNARSKAHFSVRKMRPLELRFCHGLGSASLLSAGGDFVAGLMAAIKIEVSAKICSKPANLDRLAF